MKDRVDKDSPDSRQKQSLIAIAGPFSLIKKKGLSLPGGPLGERLVEAPSKAH